MALKLSKLLIQKTKTFDVDII